MQHKQTRRTRVWLRDDMKRISADFVPNPTRVFVSLIRSTDIKLLVTEWRWLLTLGATVQYGTDKTHYQVFKVQKHSRTVIGTIFEEENGSKTPHIRLACQTFLKCWSHCVCREHQLKILKNRNIWADHIHLTSKRAWNRKDFSSHCMVAYMLRVSQLPIFSTFVVNLVFVAKKTGSGPVGRQLAT